jgi:hypothetical protein
MIEVLSQIRQLLEVSKESVWAALTPQEVISIMECEISLLRSEGRIRNRVELQSLFAPTAAIQEIAMANGWSEYYVTLSARFDSAFQHVSGL